jgi:hypothetical protein
MHEEASVRDPAQFRKQLTEEGSVEEETAAKVLPQKFSSAKRMRALSFLIPLTS